MLPLLPEKRQRAAEAQCRHSADLLFGVDNAAEVAGEMPLIERALEDLTINLWRLMRAYERALAWLPEHQYGAEEEKAGDAFLAVFRALLPVLRRGGIKIVHFVGRDFDPNYPVKVVNADEFDGVDGLVVTEMLEPLLMRGGKAVRFGKLMVSRKGGKDASGN